MTKGRSLTPVSPSEFEFGVRHAVTTPAALAARVTVLGELHPRHAAAAASVRRLLLGDATALDRARTTALRRTYGEDPVIDALFEVGAVALLLDEGDPLAEAWFGEAGRSLTRAGVPL
jgi:hypothetical protein